MGINVGDMVMKEGWDRWYRVKRIEGESLFLIADDGTILKYMLFPPTIAKGYQWIVKPMVETPRIDHFEYDGFRVPTFGDWIGEYQNPSKEYLILRFIYAFTVIKYPIYRPVYVQCQKSAMGFDEWW